MLKYLLYLQLLFKSVLFNSKVINIIKQKNDKEAKNFIRNFKKKYEFMHPKFIKIKLTIKSQH